MFKQLRLEIGLKDALVEMPKFNKWLSSLLRNKEKLEEIAITTVNAECSAIIMNKVPEKLEDPGKFLIPCALQELDRTSALADSGASINLLPHSIYKKLGLEALTPTRMTLELANHSITHPMGIAEDVVVRVDGVRITQYLNSPRPNSYQSKLPYPERMKVRENDKPSAQHSRFLKMFKQLRLEIGLKDALVEMPKLTNGSSLLKEQDADSGASINLLPHSIYKKLGLEALTPTRMTLELANRSITHPMGIAEDVVVRVDGFTFLADFVFTQIPLFEFDDNFKSSYVNPLLEENDKDVEIKSSSSFILTSPEESEFEADSIPSGIDLTLPPTFEVSSSNPTSPTLTREKVCSWKMSKFFSLVQFVWKMMTRIAIRKKIICLLATYLHQTSKPLSRPQEVEEIKEKEDKDLTVAFDSTKSSILPPPLLDSDSPFTAELSASITLNSLRNEDKVFKPGILVYHAIHDKNLVTLEENLKENISSGTLLVFKEPSFLLPPPNARCTDISKITRKPSKTGKHGHEERKSTKEARDAKPKAGKVKKSKLWSTLGQFSVNKSQP
ncbi:reverse transcriptase domain-containing protein [Tanacetum coccineum]|uniref:Reverse transcriptase domain-containing protein n=1 Tax=Tanacetum coccineum TaxID=301880 RepID=A0ABQ4Y2U0_9ASTR